MTAVEIKYCLTSSTCKILIDAERVSSFSDLSACEGQPLHLCAAKLLRLLDEEIDDTYTIHITGVSFQIQLLTELAKDSHYCTEVTGTELEASEAADAIQQFFISLARRYNISSSKQDLKIHVYGSASVSASVSFPYLLLDEHTPELQIEYPQISYRPHCKTVAVFSDIFDIQYKGNSCILFLPDFLLNAFFEYYYAICKVQPFAEDIANACKYVSISEEDKLSLTYMMTQIPQYYFFLEKNTAEIGEQVGFLFRSFPESAFTLQYDKENIPTFTSDTISCMADGIVKLFVCNKSGHIVSEQSLNCIRHNYITSIQLHAPKTVLKENEHIMVNAFTFPENAEDTNSLKWEVSDYSIAHITANGEVIALKPGRFSIIVKSQTVSTSVEMQVVAEVESISVQASRNSVEIGGTVELLCTIYPSDAHIKGLIWSLENEKMGKLTVANDDYHCLFTATTDHLGTTKILCHPRGTNCDIIGSCEISVQPENRPSGLISLVLIFTILGSALSFLIPVISAAGGGILGCLADFFLPISLIMGLIGRAKYPGIKTFKTCLILNIIFTATMLFIAFGIG